MTDLFYWILAGGVFGFYRAWKKTAVSAERSRKILDEIPDVNSKGKAEAIGYNRGLRLVALAVGTGGYALFGAVIWGLATLFVKLLDG